jgi:hypothetical protein
LISEGCNLASPAALGKPKIEQSQDEIQDDTLPQTGAKRRDELRLEREVTEANLTPETLRHIEEIAKVFSNVLKKSGPGRARLLPSRDAPILAMISAAWSLAPPPREVFSNGLNPSVASQR